MTQSPLSESTPRLLPQCDAFTQAYIACAIWLTSDQSDDSGGTPLEDLGYDAGDLDPESLALMVRDCTQFQAENAALLAQAYGQPRRDGLSYNASNAGHDFWLTRNGHGAGFWDRQLGEMGDKLTEAAHQWHGVDLYLGDDEMIYCGLA